MHVYKMIQDTSGYLFFVTQTRVVQLFATLSFCHFLHVTPLGFHYRHNASSYRNLLYNTKELAYLYNLGRSVFYLVVYIV